MDLLSRYFQLPNSLLTYTRLTSSPLINSFKIQSTNSYASAKYRSLSRLIFLGLASCLLLLSACQPSSNDPSPFKEDKAKPRELSQEVYIWQRQWRDANQSALVESQGTFSGVRILALQAHPRPNGADIWFEVNVNHAWLQADPRPKVAVIRLDGQLTRLNNHQVISKISELVKEWQAQGTVIAGIEIDHDSASSKLAAYNAFLRQLKSQIPNTLKLSITALTAWLSSTEFPSLFEHIDELVLQIHSVSDPRLGLFDATQGWQWVEQLSRLAKVSYLIALPSYGSAVYSTTSDYRVESEVPLRMPLAETSSQHLTRQELMADPEVLQSFVKKLHTLADPNLRGMIWFRLPLEGDKRMWPLSTLIAVAKQQPLAPQVELQMVSQPMTELAQEPAPNAKQTDQQTKANKPPQTTLFQLVLVNKGNLAGKVPSQLSLAAQSCSGYDAQNGYIAKLAKGTLTWQLPQVAQLEDKAAPLTRLSAPSAISATVLSPNGRRVIGWARCESLHLQGIYAP